MDQQSYLSLCREASLLLELPDPDMLGTEGFLEYEGIGLALYYDAEVVNDRLFCYVDGGQVSAEGRERILERLLMLNLLSGSKTTGVYALDPSSGNILFCVHLMQPERLNPEILARHLRSNIERALNLREILKQDIDDLDFVGAVKQIFQLEEIASPSELA